MKQLIILSISDLRSTFRDPMFKVLLFFPFIAFGIVRWVVPPLVIQFPLMEAYRQVILMWACLQSATMFGFIYGFLFLEEKEEHIWQAIRVLPISGLQLVASRLLIGLVISILVNFVLLRYGGILHAGLIKEFILSIQFSLAAPLIALTLGVFAGNRIEGLAQMKIVNILLIIPGLIYVIPGKALHLTALIPTYWSFRSLELAGTGVDFLIVAAIGLVVHIGAILVLNRKLELSMSN